MFLGAAGRSRGCPGWLRRAVDARPDVALDGFLVEAYQPARVEWILSLRIDPQFGPIIMFGLGLDLTINDFRRVGRHPRAVAVALACQLILLPAICFGLVVLLDLPALLGIGMMLLAASPGGTSANLFSHLFRGDVALNITLTSNDDQLDFGIIGCRQTLPSLQRLIHHIEDSLSELEKAVSA